jgi:hypothetical protein
MEGHNSATQFSSRHNEFNLDTFPYDTRSVRSENSLSDDEFFARPGFLFRKKSSHPEEGVEDFEFEADALEGQKQAAEVPAKAVTTTEI